MPKVDSLATEFGNLSKCERIELIKKLLDQLEMQEMIEVVEKIRGYNEALEMLKAIESVFSDWDNEQNIVCDNL